MPRRTVNSRIENLRNMDPSQRLDAVGRAAGLDQGTAAALTGEGILSTEVANGMIENVVGKFELPLGVASNFLINGRDYLVPMAVEEPSVVAAYCPYCHDFSDCKMYWVEASEDGRWGHRLLYEKCKMCSVTRLTKSMVGTQLASGAMRFGAPGVLRKSAAGTRVVCSSIPRPSRQLVTLLDQCVATRVMTFATFMFVGSALLVVSVSSSISSTDW